MARAKALASAAEKAVVSGLKWANAWAPVWGLIWAPLMAETLVRELEQGRGVAWALEWEKAMELATERVLAAVSAPATSTHQGFLSVSLGEQRLNQHFQICKSPESAEGSAEERATELGPG